MFELFATCSRTPVYHQVYICISPPFFEEQQGIDLYEPMMRDKECGIGLFDGLVTLPGLHR